MGTVADKERDPSESSGISDMMEIAASLGLEDDDVASAGVTRADDDEAEDDLDNVASGYGGAAAAALIADASIEPEAPAANAARPSPPPPPPPKTSATRPPSGPVKPVEATAFEDDLDAAISASAAPKVEAPKKPVSEPVPVVAAPKPAAAKPAAPKAAASVSAPVPVVAAARPPQEKKRGSGMLIAVGVLALGAIGWFIYNSTTQVKEHPVAVNEVRTAAPAPVEPPPPPPEVKKAPEPPPPPPVVEPVVEEPPPPPEPEAKVEVTVSQKKKRDKGDKADTGDKALPTKAEPVAQPSQAEIDEKFRTECLLNPSKPGCDEIRKRQRDAADLDAKLADKLSQSQIRDGFAKVKGKAKACGSSHGATTGTIVRVKVSIAGGGDVLSVDELAEHKGTPLGDCVENALKDAHFARFTSESQGTIYPVTF